MNMTFDDLYNQIRDKSEITIDDEDKEEIELMYMYRYLTYERKKDVINFVKMIYDNEKK